VTIDPADPLAVAVTEAIQSGDLDRLRRLLAEHPGLATARLGDDRPGGMTRTLLHVATDWPGHYPNGPATVALLVEAGADVNARFGGAAATTRPRSTGRPAATTSRSWTPCSTSGPTSRRQGRSSPAAPP
jgi:hypothetical protein